MLLRFATTHRPATDLGYLLAKNPARAQTFALSFGTAHVFYPEASAEHCIAALYVDVDPVRLSRRDDDLEIPYVNDRPYVASSFLSVAIAQVFSSALQGRCRDKPALADTRLPLRAEVPALVARGGPDLVRRLFVPLGYDVAVEPLPVDPVVGTAAPRLYALRLQHTTRVVDLLSHLYVLLPVLDDDKHYWVGDAEVEKLLDHGEGWLAEHPERELIVSRYLLRQRHLAAAALARLLPEAADQNDPAGDEGKASAEAGLEAVVALPERRTLQDERVHAVLQVLREVGARSVLDLGCAEGRLLRELAKDARFARVGGMDVSARALEIAAARLARMRLADELRARVTLFQGALTYRDARLRGFDALCAIEVIEHMDLTRHPAFARVVFGDSQPRVVIVTTPNMEYNVRLPGLAAGNLRHGDHRFEWSRAQFRAFTDAIAAQYPYDVRIVPIGPLDDTVGAPTQMAVFTRRDGVEAVLA